MGSTNPSHFKPGQSGNKKGRKKGTTTVPKIVREYNKKKIEEIISKYLDMGSAELKKIMLDKTTPSIDLIVIKVITEAIKKGDCSRLSFLLDRTIGKVKEEVGVTVKSIDEFIMSNV